jgi:hypothetical protein
MLPNIFISTYFGRGYLSSYFISYLTTTKGAFRLSNFGPTSDQLFATNCLPANNWSEVGLKLVTCNKFDLTGLHNAPGCAVLPGSPLATSL